VSKRAESKDRLDKFASKIIDAILEEQKSTNITGTQESTKSTESTWERKATSFLDELGGQ
jgi:hypothetical protein